MQTRNIGTLSSNVYEQLAEVAKSKREAESEEESVRQQEGAYVEKKGRGNRTYVVLIIE